MNPHLLYAQAIKGRSHGRGIGIIDTLHLIEPARAASCFEKAGQLKGEELAAMKKWFADYLTWMTTHENGMEEMNAENNHGTCWVMQVAAFASFTGDEEKLAMCRKRYKEVLLPEPDGRGRQLPARAEAHEALRLRPVQRRRDGDRLPDPLDARTTTSGRSRRPTAKSMRKGVAWIHPYIADKSKWPYKQDVMYWDQWPVRSPVLLFGGLAYDEPKYLDTWKTLEANPTNEEVLRNLPIREPVLWVGLSQQGPEGSCDEPSA